jgi:hypothetical protein
MITVREAMEFRTYPGHPDGALRFHFKRQNSDGSYGYGTFNTPSVEAAEAMLREMNRALAGTWEWSIAHLAGC